MWRVRIILLLVLAVAYLLSPLDILPEAVFGFLGLLDDVVVIATLLVMLTIVYRATVIERFTN